MRKISIMKLFELQQKFGRISIILFRIPHFFCGLKLNFRDKTFAKKNTFIPLGTSCYPRMLLTKNGFKFRKKDGELSFPFDLSVTPISAVLHFLKTDFKDFFDNVTYSVENNCWFNDKLGVIFPHDNFKERDKIHFVKRYIQRIKNFYNMLESNKPLIFFSSIKEGEKVCASELNEIYDILKSRCKGNFKYIVLHAPYSDGFLNKDDLNKNINYRPIKAPTENYFTDWFIEGKSKDKVISDYTEKCLSNIYEISYSKNMCK